MEPDRPTFPALRLVLVLTVLAAILLLLFTAYSVLLPARGSEERQILAALKSTTYPSGSNLYFCFVPAGSKWKACEINGDKETRIKDAGYLVYIDEQPTYDWAHTIQVLFVPEDEADSPRILFHDSTFPTFEIEGPDGEELTDWQEL